MEKGNGKMETRKMSATLKYKPQGTQRNNKENNKIMKTKIIIKYQRKSVLSVKSVF